MANTDTKTCNFNCVCNREGCAYKHYLVSADERKAFKELVDSAYDKTLHNETDPDGVRHRICVFGHLCGKEACTFKHFCNFEGRRLLQQSWRKQSRKAEAFQFIDELNEKYSFDEAELEKLRGLVERKK